MPDLPRTWNPASQRPAGSSIRIEIDWGEPEKGRKRPSLPVPEVKPPPAPEGGLPGPGPAGSATERTIVIRPPRVANLQDLAASALRFLRERRGQVLLAAAGALALGWMVRRILKARRKKGPGAAGK